jgi:hypothetical protein
MRRLRRALAVAVTLALAGGCDRAEPPVLGPVAVEASYRLQLNGLPVGHAFFRLRVADRRYRIEALTVPDTTLADTQEVLERSEGRFEQGRAIPERFEHLVFADDGTDAVTLEFDWQAQRLRLGHGDEQREVVLLPNTQDRLSYLLVAHRLATTRGTATALQIAMPTATEESRLERVGPGRVVLPQGPRPAVEFRRVTPSPDEQRRLWLAPETCPLPLRIAHEAGGQQIDMQLQTCIDIDDGEPAATD